MHDAMKLLKLFSSIFDQMFWTTRPLYYIDFGCAIEEERKICIKIF